MFLERLYKAVQKICSERRFTYESASERCDLSARCFADIARGKTHPTIETLEKLCIGFSCTPNDLLLSNEGNHSSDEFRIPMPITHIRIHEGIHGRETYPVCPNCNSSIEIEWQAYCINCGQCLDWIYFNQNKVTVISCNE